MSSTPSPVTTSRRASLGFSHDDASRPLPTDLDATVAPGESLCVIGPSGSGKTTLARLVGGLVAPTPGTVHLGCLDIARFPCSERQALPGYLQQDPVLVSGTIAENIASRRRARERDVVAAGRACEGRPDAPFLLFGQSAGARTLVRVAATCPLEGARRIIVATPSAYVAASLIDPTPYGFAASADVMEGENRPKFCLSQPLSLHLGADDTGTDRLDGSVHARRQGVNRLERGRSLFERARAVAAARGWPFGWRLVLAPGIGHSSRGMLRAPQLHDVFAIAAAG